MTDTTPERESAQLWSQLRRRKVVQWGIAYAAGAWGLLQGLEYVTDTFHWPEQIQQLATIALLIGLPVVLVLAWYHGDRGEQRVTRPELAILTLLFLLGGGIFWRYDRAGDGGTAATPLAAVPASSATADSRPSIAVLPFENRSNLNDDAFFVDGIHDDILTQLTKIGAVKVIARTSVERFRDTTSSTKEIGEKLGVSRVLEGGVQRAGDRVRVTVQLIDVQTDAHVWAETYDRELTAENIFVIQSEVAAAIAAALNATLNSTEKAQINAVLTQSLEAWETYQLGRQRMGNSASANLAEAEKYFLKAIDLDPKYALPYAGLADTLMAQIGWGGAPQMTNLARAEQMARKSLELGPQLAESWAASAWVAWTNDQYDLAEGRYRKAIALNPNYAWAYLSLARLLASQGRSEEALVYSMSGLQLDPLSPAANFSNARTLAHVGRFDESEVRYRRIIELDPGRPNTYRDLAMLNAYARNDFVVAIPFAHKVVQLDPEAPYARCNLAALYSDLGNLTEAARILESARKLMPGSAQVLDCLAELRLYQRDEAEAAVFARQALAIDPDLRHAAVLVLAALDMKRGDYESARSRYAQAFPTMLGTGRPEIPVWYLCSALDFAYVLRMTGETGRAMELLDRAQEIITTVPRLGESGYGLADVQIHALRGNKAAALAALREAQKAGWRYSWRYYRDFDPALTSIRNEIEFQAVFSEIERDMARQRAALAARPKDGPQEVGDSRV